MLLSLPGTNRFEAPELRVGPFKWRFGKDNTAALSLYYVDDRVRAGIGRAGSYFLFRRVDEDEQAGILAKLPPQTEEDPAPDATF